MEAVAIDTYGYLNALLDCRVPKNREKTFNYQVKNVAFGGVQGFFRQISRWIDSWVCRVKLFALIRLQRRL